MAESEWADDLLEEMLRRMGEGETITSIAADARMPSYTTMWRMENAGDDLAERITHAREMGFVARAEKIIAKVSADNIDPAKGRLAFDAERWYLGKMQPKRFGEKQTHEHSGPDGKAIPVSHVTDDQLAAIATGRA